MQDKPKKKGRGGGKDGEGEDAEGETYYDAMKQEMGERAARTKAAMDALDPLQRVAMEGHRAGTYVRLRFTGSDSSCGHLHEVVLPYAHNSEGLQAGSLQGGCMPSAAIGELPAATPEV